MKKNDVKYANFVCKFGEKNMMDMLEEIILPAFVRDSIVRRRGENNYLFLETGVVDLGTNDNPEFCIVGQFVKAIVLRRDQVLDAAGGELVQDPQFMESAPSAFFVLKLNGHRLMYMAETPHAPTLSEFETTARFRIRKMWEKYVADAKQLQSTELQDDNNSHGLTPPTIQVTPLGGGLELEEFLQKFEKIEILDIVVNPRNDEVDGGKLFQLMDEARKGVGGETGRIQFRSSEGLDADTTGDLLQDMAGSGNQRVKVTGKDASGDKISGNEDDYSVVDHIAEPAPDRVSRATRLLQMFREKLQQGILRDSATSAESQQKLLRVFRNGRP
ncbi:MAG TPA: hypothetical protein PKV67_11515 [Hyphomonas sp.]|nr:hypothetical protein [Hyphomonas sp.]HRJ01395.1 hypothetical protein [Hyphomonas sp.]